MTALLLLLAAPPNVVWIVGDDLGCELGCYGYAGVDTPNADRHAPKREKRAYYERGLRKRGLPADVSDEAYLDWWQTELNARP